MSDNEEKDRCLEKDLQSFVRVRNRLFQTPDERLPGVLKGLLPVLLRRLDQIIMTSLYDITSSSSSHSAAVATQCQVELTGIFVDATERVRANRDMPVTVWLEPVWSVLLGNGGDDQDNNNDNDKSSSSLQSAVTQTMALVLLQTGLPRTTHSAQAIPAFIKLVDRLYQQIIIVESDEMVVLSETTRSHFRITGWLLLDAMALVGCVKVVEDWDMEDHEEYAYEEMNVSSSSGLEHHVNDPNKQQHAADDAGCLPAAVQAAEQDGAGTFDLCLDVMLFWPAPPPPRWGPNQADSSSMGISTQGLARMNLKRRGPGATWHEGYLKQVKYAVLRYAIWPVQRGLFQSNQEVAFNHDTNTAGTRNMDDDSGSTVSDRSLLLAVLVAIPSSMHGRLALSYLNWYDSSQRPLSRVADQWHRISSCSSCSLAVVCSLLVLVLGDTAALPILYQYPNAQHLWNAILGPRPSASDFTRPPLPVSRAARAVEFIRTHYRPTLADLSRKNAGMQLLVHLIGALQDPTHQHGVYWGMQLMDTLLYQQLLPPLQKTTTTTAIKDTNDTMNDTNKDDSWTRHLYHQCLQTAHAVLCAVPQAHHHAAVDGMYRRGEQPPEPLPGVPGPFGNRVDLNRLLTNHRVAQKKRQLNSDVAVSARETAYQMIAGLVVPFEESFVSSTSKGKDENDNNDENNDNGDENHLDCLDLAITVFQCAASEEINMQSSVTAALDELLKACQKRRTKTTDDRGDQQKRQCAVAPLLPALLCAASADSTVARLAVAKWCRAFLIDMDPDAAVHMCRYLANDPDPYVAAAAAQTIRPPTTPVVPVRKGCIPIQQVSMKDPQQLEGIQLDLALRCTALSNAFGIPMTAAGAVLQEFTYSMVDAEKALGDDLEAALKRSGVWYRVRQANEMDLDDECPDYFTCTICYEDFPSADGFAISCGHRFCSPCWISYLEAIAESGNNNTLLKAPCPNHKCHERLGPDDVKLLLPDLLPRWNNALLSIFVELDTLYRPCPGPDCFMVAQSTMEQSLSFSSVTCTHCQTAFCFQCGGLPHKPAMCQDFDRWNQIFGSSDFWVKKNSKPCPSCKVPIEKNQGCNHMQCSQCKTDFCWLCLGPLYRHLEAHTCNRFDPVSTAENDEERRALFFTDRYQAHDDAELFVKDRVKSIEENTEKFSEKLWFAREDELESLWDAIVALASARNFLKYSYIAAWSKRHDEVKRDVFESHQATLELVTERLSQMTMMNFEQLYHEKGERGIRLFFRAMVFHTSSVVNYMGRLEEMERDDHDAVVGRRNSPHFTAYSL